jgi:voltage-gated potassium channel Kch
MDSDRRAAERARLERYIADSLTRRRRLARALLPVALAALVFTFIARTPGLIALVIAVSTIGIGLYITTAHISEFRARIAELDDTGPRTAARPRRARR